MLVVVVVFLFLGNLRATIIPAVAVPVSLIGTFAVLLAIGYSANTVSLLAMVLAIGIVVDDAIVVVENVERVLMEEPDLTPARGDDQGDAPDHRPDHRHHPGAAVGVRAGGVHSRPVRPAVPPVRGHHQRRDADLGAQRADAVAGVVRGVAAPRAAAARIMGRVLRGIDYVRDGYAAVVQRLVRVAVAVAAGDRGLSRSAATGCRRSRRRASCPRRTRAPSSSTCNFPTAPRWRAPRDGARQVEAIAAARCRRCRHASP